MKFLSFIIVTLFTFCLSGCGFFYEVGRFDHNIAKDPRCKNIVGKYFRIKKENYIWAVTKGKLHAADFVPSKNNLVDGKLVKKYYPIDFVIDEGTIIKITDVYTDGHILAPFAKMENIRSVHGEVYLEDHPPIYVDCTWFFLPPFNHLKPDPKFIEPVEFSH
jgi:hypothetical protein